MHVGSLHLVRVPARQRAGFLERVRGHVASRLHLVPVFTRRIASLPFDLASPVWIEDREVDLDHHIRRARLPKPGTMAQLEALVARLHAKPLDRERPLWMFHVIEGLATGEVAWYAKVHHAALDGAAGVKLAEALLDDSPRGRKVPPPAAAGAGGDPGHGATCSGRHREERRGIRQVPARHARGGPRRDAGALPRFRRWPRRRAAGAAACPSALPRHSTCPSGRRAPLPRPRSRWRA